eukprot:gb/GECH01004299.1/.p1 GENE.gb/GECH01004299.1/~~gb/GECH01004299.1/.p1  ORF type:complete len:914 (+),score=153.72 gb/GECH01004299.1/:1-2742(+)
MTSQHLPQVIDYNTTHVTLFISTLDAALTSGNTDKVQSVWKDVENNPELATVYITVMAGKMLLLEEKKEEKKNKHKEKDVSSTQVVSHYKLGDHSYNSGHRLLSDAEHLDSPRTSTPRRRNSETIAESIEQIVFTGSLQQGNILLSILVVSLEHSYIRHEPSLLHILDLWHNQCIQQHHVPIPAFPSPSYLTEPLIYSTFYQECHNNSISNTSLSTVMASGPSLSHAVLDLLRPHPSYRDTIKRVIRLCLCFDVESMEAERPSVTIDHMSPASMAPGYAFMALQRMSANDGESVLQSLAEILEEGGEDMRILQLIRHLLGHMHIQNKGDTDHSLLTHLIQKIKPLYIQPLPLGGYAKDTLLMLKAESLLPGCAMRQRLFRHTRCIRYADGTFCLSPRRVYLLLNNSTEHAPHLKEWIAQNAFEENQWQILETAQANLLLNIMEEHDLVDDALLSIAPSILSNYYPAAYVVVSRGVGGRQSSKEGVNKETEALREIRNRILQSDNLHTNNSGRREENKLTRKRSPPMPEVEIDVIDMPEENDIMGCEAWHKIYRLNTWYHQLFEIVQKALRDKSNNGINSGKEKEKCLIDVAVAGGSGTLQRFVNGYTALHRKEASLMEQVQLRVYVLPLGRVNMLTSYLERHDGWFSTLLHVPMLSASRILPSPDISSFGTPSSSLLPQRYNRRFLHNYFTDAIHPYPVSIMRCECIYYESSPLGKDRKQSAKAVKAKEYVMVPFCQEAEVSASSHALYLKNVEKKKAFRKLRPLEIEQHKSFKYSGHSATLSYLPSDTMGQCRNREVTVAEEPRTYSTIRVRTVTRFGHSGSNHGPHHCWFEVTTVDYESSRKNKRVREFDTADHYHAYKVTIVADGDTYMMLDGELYGPYHKFMISAEEPNSSRLSSFHAHTFDTLTSEFN